MPLARIFGIVVALVGITFAVRPDWFSPLSGGSTPPADTFEAIERRVRGGLVLGLGLIFIAVPSPRPWSKSVPSAIFYFMTGALAMRILGIMVEGAVPKQWLLVAIEVVVMAAAALWLWRSGAATP